eukprot:2677260-Lingulodinium_polyedra.AAC.1
MIQGSSGIAGGGPIQPESPECQLGSSTTGAWPAPPPPLPCGEVARNDSSSQSPAPGPRAGPRPRF